MRGFIKRGATLVCLIFILVGFVSAAEYVFESENIVDEVSGGELIRGNMKMSFYNQSNGNFTSSFGGGISLIDLMDLSGNIQGVDYSCFPEICENTYKAVSGTGKELRELNLPNDKIYGFKLSGGDEITIEDFSFDIEGIIEPSCNNQIELDLLNDGNIDFFNNNYLDEVCATKNWGCFENEDTSNAIIGTSKYCQKMTLKPAPAYTLGARVINGSIQGQLTLGIYSLEDESFLEECEPEIGEGLIECVANYSSIEEFDAFVCIEGESGTDYRIKSETNDPCGMTGVDSAADFSSDFEIYSQPMKFGIVNSSFNEDVFERLNKNKGSLIDHVLQGYLDEVYAGDCTGEDGCVIPFIIRGIAENITLDKFNVRYSVSGITREELNTYELEESSPKISANNITLKVSKMGASAPDEEGLKDFSITFEGEELFSKSVNVTEGFEFGISPKIVPLKVNTEFKIVDGGGAVRALWNFGEGGSSKTGLSVTHRYTSIGEYSVSVIVTDKDGKKSTKTFSIVVESAKDTAQGLIKKYSSRLPNISSQMDNFDSFTKQVLEEYLNITNAEQELTVLENRFNSATNESEYLDILENLLNMNVPQRISVSISGNAPFAAGFNNINVGHIEEISEENIEDNNALKNAIISWYDSNYDLSIAYESIGFFEESIKTETITKFVISATPKKGVEETFFVIDYPLGDIRFKNNQGIPLNSGSYINIGEGFSGSLEFIVLEAVSISDVGMYVSPEVSKLTIVGNVGEPSEIPTDYPIGFLLTSLGILLAITLSVYIFLQEWYKSKYEKYLFKENDQLYNVINFISNGRKANMEDNKIENKLNKSGWSKEQINYAFRKIDSKRTGMYEIPIFKFFEQMRVKKEIEKRSDSKEPPVSKNITPQGGKTDNVKDISKGGARFIKRS